MPRSPRNHHQEVMQLYYDGKLTSVHCTPFYKNYSQPLISFPLPPKLETKRIKVGEELIISFLDGEYSAEIEVKFIAHGHVNAWELASNFFRKRFRKLSPRLS